jgi:DNA repair photolyase
VSDNTRKILYIPSGRAGAYAKGGYAVNLYKGCTHGCLYCYVPGFCRLDRGEFHRTVAPAPNLLERLERDCARHQKKGDIHEPIFMCFTCDPYPLDPAVSKYTREAIAIILGYGFSVNILTKGGLRAVRDFDLLATDKRNLIGTTLTFYSEEKSKQWEPGAASVGQRIEMLAKAKNAGIQTWASIEPVIDPTESLAVMGLALPFVDEFKIGKWNHDYRAKQTDWRHFLDLAESLMQNHGKRYIIKQDLLDAASARKG